MGKVRWEKTWAGGYYHGSKFHIHKANGVWLLRVTTPKKTSRVLFKTFTEAKRAAESWGK